MIYEIHWDSNIHKVNSEAASWWKLQNHANGIDFITTHLVQTYLVMGLAVGVLSNYISDPIEKALKKVLKPGVNEDVEESKKRFALASSRLLDLTEFNPKPKALSLLNY